MVRLTLAAGINASSPINYQPPAPGNPASGFGITAGAVTPPFRGVEEGFRVYAGNRTSGQFAFDGTVVRFGNEANNSLLPYNQQIALNQSVFDTTYYRFGSSVDLNTWQQYAGIDGFYSLSTLVNSYVFATLLPTDVRPQWPDGKVPAPGVTPAKQFQWEWVIPGQGNQAGQNYPSDGAVILP